MDTNAIDPRTGQQPTTGLALSRRRLLLAGTATVAGAGVTAASGVLPCAANASNLQRVTPRMADSLLDSFGSVTHPSWAESQYSDHSELIRWLKKLQIRHIRTRLTLQPEVLNLFADLARHDIKVNAVCGVMGDPQPMDKLMKAVSDRFDNPSKVFSAFEGINEPNNNGVAWIEETRDKTEALFKARREFGLTEIPIVAPALARVTSGGVQGATTFEQAQNLGDMTAWVDRGNMHVYPRGLPPSADIDYFTRCAEHVSGKAPITVTEGGYFTARNYSGSARRVGPRVAAAYGPQKILEHVLAGNTRYFRYEFLEKPSGRSWDRLATFGLLRTDSTRWRPKPEFGATRRLLRKFCDPGARFSPEPIELALTDAPRDLRSMVFAKRDGTHLLALWLDRVIWDPAEEELLVGDINKCLADVRLELGSARDGNVTHVVDHRLAKTFSSARSVRIPLTSGVTVVKLRA